MPSVGVQMSTKQHRHVIYFFLAEKFHLKNTHLEKALPREEANQGQKGMFPRHKLWPAPSGSHPAVSHASLAESWLCGMRVQAEESLPALARVSQPGEQAVLGEPHMGDIQSLQPGQLTQVPYVHLYMCTYMHVWSHDKSEVWAKDDYCLNVSRLCWGLGVAG